MHARSQNRAIRSSHCSVARRKAIAITGTDQTAIVPIATASAHRQRHRRRSADRAPRPRPRPCRSPRGHPADPAPENTARRLRIRVGQFGVESGAEKSHMPTAWRPSIAAARTRAARRSSRAYSASTGASPTTTNCVSACCARCAAAHRRRIRQPLREVSRPTERSNGSVLAQAVRARKRARACRIGRRQVDAGMHDRPEPGRRRVPCQPRSSTAIGDHAVHVAQAGRQARGRPDAIR